jgi:Flp pilus assembly pilin Flp
MTSFRKFVQDEEGLSGAETALLCLVGLGLLLFVAKKIKDGAGGAATKAQGMLDDTDRVNGLKYDEGEGKK